MSSSRSRCRACAKAERRRRATEALRKRGSRRISCTKSPTRCRGGQMQRVAIARAHRERPGDPARRRTDRRAGLRNQRADHGASEGDCPGPPCHHGHAQPGACGALLHPHRAAAGWAGRIRLPPLCGRGGFPRPAPRGRKEGQDALLDGARPEFAQPAHQKGAHAAHLLRRKHRHHRHRAHLGAVLGRARLYRPRRRRTRFRTTP